MSTVANHHATTVSAKRRASRWLVRCFLVVIVCVAAARVVSIVASLADRLIGGVVGILAAAAAAVEVPVTAACDRVVESPDAQAMLGGPILCGTPLQEIEWLSAQKPEELEFAFTVTGFRGEGQAHCVARATDGGFELKHLDVTGPDGRVIEIPVP